MFWWLSRGVEHFVDTRDIAYLSKPKNKQLNSLI